MKKIFTTSICALGVATCGALMATDNFINLANAADLPELLKNDKVVLIFVYPPGQPCKNMIATATKVAKEDTKALFVIIDIRVFPGLRSQYHVGGLPALILFKNGVELARSTGQRDANSLRAFMAKTFLGARRAFIASPLAYTAAWIKGHFKIDPVCENQ
jgi:thioredoxin 1